MQKLFRFNFKLDAHDRDCLLWLSARLQRSQADTVRWLLRQAAGGGITNYELRMTNGEGEKGSGGAGEHPFTPAPLRPFIPAPEESLPFEPLGITGDWEEWGRGEEIMNYELGITNGEGEKGRKGEREIAPSPLLPFSPAPLRPFSPAPEKEGPQ